MRKNKYLVYTVLVILALGVIYTACKDVSPQKEKVENTIELKLNK